MGPAELLQLRDVVQEDLNVDLWQSGQFTGRSIDDEVGNIGPVEPVGIEFLGGASPIYSPGKGQYDGLYERGLARFVASDDEIQLWARLDRQIAMDAIAADSNLLDHGASLHSNAVHPGIVLHAIRQR